MSDQKPLKAILDLEQNTTSQCLPSGRALDLALASFQEVEGLRNVEAQTSSYVNKPGALPARDVKLVKEVRCPHCVTKDVLSLDAGKDLLSELEALRELEAAARTLTHVCKKRKIDLSWELSGGLRGQRHQTLSKVSLLDRLKQSLAALDEVRSR